jgi:hypothetical protein
MMRNPTDAGRDRGQRKGCRQNITADGTLRELKFEVPGKESSWIAARVLPAAHTKASAE